MLFAEDERCKGLFTCDQRRESLLASNMGCYAFFPEDERRERSLREL